MSLPDGTVTFLFTDIEGSTRLWEETPEHMMDALRMHDRVVDAAVSKYRGFSVKPRGEGDSRFVVFSVAADALAAVAEVQRSLAAVEWPTPRPIRVRASLHTGRAELELGDYYGPTVNRAARLRAIAHGAQTVLSASTFELVQDVVPDDVSLVDLGRHRLKDLSRPEHVYQMNVDGLPSSFPPLLSVDAVPNNLPSQLTGLIGRDEELTKAVKLLEVNRLVTILAPGGTGKTRLAIAVAADQAPLYPQGVFFVELAEIDSSESILQAMADTVGLSLSSEEDSVEQVIGYLKSRRILFVLDNFEHVLDGAHFVSRILREAPEVRVMVTSRTKLNVEGESVFNLGGLSNSWSDPEQAMGAGAAQLFLQAARRAKADFVLSSEDMEHLGRILKLTDGTPLAIILAAAWVEILTVREIADELEEGLELLQTSTRDVPNRQRSMRAVFDYTWTQLGTSEQTVFSGLAVFRGGFTREAASVVAGASLVDLAKLSGKSLLVRDDETGRFSIHELLRQYAEQELRADSERHRKALNSHADFFSGVAEKAGDLLSSADQLRMVAILEEDLENVRVAWRHSVRESNGANIRRIIIPLFFLYEIRGWYQSGEDLFGAASEGFTPRIEDGPSVVATSLLWAVHAWFLGLLGRAEIGRPQAEKAVTAIRGQDDDEALWLALQCNSLVLAYGGGDWSQLAQEGLVLGEGMDGPFWNASMKNWRAGAASNQGELDLGARLLTEGRQVLKRLDEHWYLGANSGHHGTIAMRQGDTEKAIGLFRQSVDRSGELSHLRILQLSLVGLGSAALQLGRLDEAENAYLEALEVSERMGLIREVLQALIHIASVRAATDRNGEAAELLASVVAEPASSNQTLWESSSLNDLATERLSELEARLDPTELAERVEAGTSKPFQILVKELLAPPADDR